MPAAPIGSALSNGRVDERGPSRAAKHFYLWLCPVAMGQGYPPHYPGDHVPNHTFVSLKGLAITCVFQTIMIMIMAMLIIIIITTPSFLVVAEEATLATTF